MKINIQKTLKSKAELLILPVFKDKKLPEEFQKFTTKEFKGEEGQTIQTQIDIKGYPSRLLVLGMGEKASLQKFAGKAGKFAKAEKLENLAIQIPEEMSDDISRIYELLLMSQYEYTKYKTKEKKSPPAYKLKAITFITSKTEKTLKKSLKEAEVRAEASALTKDLINSPSNYVDAAYMAKEARKIARENGYKIAVLTEKELKKMKWGGLLSVNQGSKKPAQVVVLEYKGGKRKEKPIAIVGKGILFDAGGLNLKPTNYIETMHQDMGGAGTVFGVFKALKKLGIKKNVLGIIPLAENLVSADSYKPSDIITMLNGKTCEITNTDAEGRLILADGITYATKLKAAEIITIATLTGAVEIALGNRYAGLITNKDELADKMREAGEKVGELAWQLPLHDDYRKKLDSEIADLTNCDITERGAGTAKGGAFLEKFVEDTPWCHIDIGGVAFTKAPQDHQQKGATSHGMGMLLEYLS